MESGMEESKIPVYCQHRRYSARRGRSPKEWAIAKWSQWTVVGGVGVKPLPYH
jgi:hypothetical protein